MLNNMDKFEYEPPYGEKVDVTIKVSRYVNNDNLYVGMDAFDTESNEKYPFTDITVNIEALPYLHSAIDTNNNGMLSITNFLIENDLALPTGEYQQSGFCVYPVYRFNAELLEKLDPEPFHEYQKAHGIELQHGHARNEKGLASVDELVKDAKGRTFEKDQNHLNNEKGLNHRSDTIGER